MSDTLELPTGETVTPDDVWLYGGYPYRYRPRDDASAFELVPLYWGDSDLDIPFEDREALVDQWDADSRGPLTDAEWERWLAAAREDERYEAAELDALADELPVDDGDAGGLFARLRRALGL